MNLYLVSPDREVNASLQFIVHALAVEVQITSLVKAAHVASMVHIQPGPSGVFLDGQHRSRRRLLSDIAGLRIQLPTVPFVVYHGLSLPLEMMPSADATTVLLNAADSNQALVDCLKWLVFRGQIIVSEPHYRFECA